MVSGALLAVIVVVVLMLVGLVLVVALSGRRHRVASRTMVTQELPIVEIPPRRDWAASVQPLRARETDGTVPGPAPLTPPARPFRPPIYRGRSAGVVVRQTPLAARWPAALRRRPRGGWLPERRSPRNG
ncbi:MAG TPA: hypothetical protein VFN57_19485 [Thermomicrobiaceae bacterium]|nr:hypothetical protein [Thermomicrobiaceae bacterium]